MMAWRLHLTNQAIQRVDILPGKPPLLAAWLSRERAAFFDLETGTPVQEKPYQAPAADSRQSAAWQEFVAGLVAPNGSALPFVRARGTAIYTTEDGRMRLYAAGGNELFLESDGKEVRLETDEEDFAAIGMDRLLGLIAALTERHRLAIYQQHIRVGVFDTGLSAVDSQPAVAVSSGGGIILVSDGQDVALIDSGGRVRKRLNAHYPIGRLACSPNGRTFVTTDAETGVIRAYSGADLTPTHQRHAIDLLQDAAQIQLIEDLPPPGAGVGTLATDNAGVLAFAVSGVVCVTTVGAMTPLPRAQPLL